MYLFIKDDSKVYKTVTNKGGLELASGHSNTYFL